MGAALARGGGASTSRSCAVSSGSVGRLATFGSSATGARSLASSVAAPCWAEGGGPYGALRIHTACANAESLIAERGAASGSGTAANRRSTSRPARLRSVRPNAVTGIGPRRAPYGSAHRRRAVRLRGRPLRRTAPCAAVTPYGSVRLRHAVRLRAPPSRRAAPSIAVAPPWRRSRHKAGAPRAQARGRARGDVRRRRARGQLEAIWLHHFA